MTHQYACPADLSPSKPVALHVDKAVLDLSDAVQINSEAVRELLRRIEPLLSKSAIIVGTLNISGVEGMILGTGFALSAKAPLAAAIEDRAAKIAGLTKEVNDALAALQI